MTDYSQNGESKILLDLFRKIHGDNFKGKLIDVGAGDGYHLSNSRMLLDSGWTGKLYDIDNKGNDEVIQERVTVGSIGHVGKIDLLSIDIDGNDYWVLEKMLESFFSDIDVIICEVNSQLPLDKSIVMPYDPNHTWDGTNAYGMSYLAAFKLLDNYGYSIYTIVNSTNIIAVKKSLNIQPLEYSYGSTWSHPEKDIAWIEVF